MVYLTIRFPLSTSNHLFHRNYLTLPIPPNPTIPKSYSHQPPHPNHEYPHSQHLYPHHSSPSLKTITTTPVQPPSTKLPTPIHHNPHSHSPPPILGPTPSPKLPLPHTQMKVLPLPLPLHPLDHRANKPKQEVASCIGALPHQGSRIGREWKGDCHRFRPRGTGEGVRDRSLFPPLIA